MFKVYCDNELIHHSQAPSPEVKLIDPKLTLEENTSGTFTFKCPTQNVGYTMIETLNSIVRVERDDVTLFNGRVINEKQDFYGTKEITVEGDLGYLNDTVQPQRKYQNRTISGFLTEIISVHNTRGGASKSFSIGYVDNTMDPEGFSDYITNYETTMECIRKNILEKYGGHIIVRYSNDKIYLDYRDNYPNTNSQKIEFGKNLLEFTKNFEVDDICTVLLPLGKKLEESDIEDVDAYTTIAKVTVPESGNNIYTPTNSIYVYNKEAMNTFGLIERCVKWSDIEETDEWPSQGTSNIMYRKAKRYLEDSQFSKLTIELSAVDLHYMNVDYTAINLYDTLLCTSKPHGMVNAQFPVKKMEISLDKPEDTKFTIGDTVMSGTLTSSVNKENEAVIRAIEDMPSESSILEEAKKNAAEALRQNLTGYVNITTSEYQGIHSEAIYISDTKLPPEVVDTNDSPLPNNDIKKLASKYWKWDLNGLSYWEKGTSSIAHQLGLALTMDGSIVADRINTGILSDGGGTGGTAKNYWNLQTGEFMLQCTANSTVGGESIASKAYATSTANSAVSSYDASLDQQKVFNKLTVNGTKKGIYMTNGDLYINASYIQTGFMSADRLQAGTITDAYGHNYWNLSTGEFMLGGDWTEIDTTGIEIKFDGNSESELNYDYCRIYYKDYREDNSPWYYIQISGDSSNWSRYPVRIPTKENFYIYWTADSSETEWGFKIKSVNYYFDNSYTATSGSTTSLPSGYTTYNKNMLNADEIETDHPYYNSEKYGWKVIYNLCTIESSSKQSAAAGSSEKVTDYNDYLDQQEVFNKLTNNGTTQCITRDSHGDLYINASYINSGFMSADRLQAGTITSTDGTLSIDLENGIFEIDYGRYKTKLKESGLEFQYSNKSAISLYASYSDAHGVTENFLNCNGGLYATRIHANSGIIGASGEYLEGETRLEINNTSISAGNIYMRSPTIRLEAESGYADVSSNIYIKAPTNNGAIYLQGNVYVNGRLIS